MKLRLYHHHDGARVAYREAGTGPALVLLHSAGLSHREFEPLVDELSHRFRLVLPDLPLHGDSEDRPRHSYSPGWVTEVMSSFITEVAGPRPLAGGHDVGSLILLEAVAQGWLAPERLVLMPSALHRRAGRGERVWRGVLRTGSIPLADRVLSHLVPRALPATAADRLSARDNPAARDLLRHALGGFAGNANRARAWSRAVRSWPAGSHIDRIEDYEKVAAPTLLLWADSDPWHPLEIAEEALDLLPDGQLRVLPQTGFLMAYDDPVAVARELAAFCG